MTLLAVVFTSCKKKEYQQDEDSILTKANIEGAVILYDEFGNKDAQTGMLVYLEKGGDATNFSGETEKDGMFLITNALYNPSYYVVYQKQGYGTYKIPYEHKYTGSTGVIGETPSLSRISTTHVHSLNVQQSGNNVEFDVAYSGSSQKGQRYIRFIFSSSSSINHDSFSYLSPKEAVSGGSESFAYSKEELMEMGLKSGEEYWVQAYGDAFKSNYYFDEYQLKKVLPNLGYASENSTPKTKFLMP